MARQRFVLRTVQTPSTEHEAAYLAYKRPWASYPANTWEQAACVIGEPRLAWVVELHGLLGGA
jgi:hypothetical protein